MHHFFVGIMLFFVGVRVRHVTKVQVVSWFGTEVQFLSVAPLPWRQPTRGSWSRSVAQLHWYTISEQEPGNHGLLHSCFGWLGLDQLKRASARKCHKSFQHWTIAHFVEASLRAMIGPSIHRIFMNLPGSQQNDIAQLTQQCVSCEALNGFVCIWFCTVLFRSGCTDSDWFTFGTCWVSTLKSVSTCWEMLETLGYT